MFLSMHSKHIELLHIIISPTLNLWLFKILCIQILLLNDIISQIYTFVNNDFQIMINIFTNFHTHLNTIFNALKNRFLSKNLKICFLWLAAISNYFAKQYTEHTSNHQK